MTQPFKQWKVLPYAKLSEIDDGILMVVGRIHIAAYGVVTAHDRGPPE